MKAAFVRNEIRYTFSMLDADNKITLVATPYDETKPEKIVVLPVHQAAGFAIKVNKSSLASDGTGEPSPAYRAFKFIKSCIVNDFCMIYVNRIIENFLVKED